MYCSKCHQLLWRRSKLVCPVLFKCSYFDVQANPLKPVPRGRPSRNKNLPFKYTTERTERHGSAIYRTPKVKTLTWIQCLKKITSYSTASSRKISRLCFPNWNGFLNQIISRATAPPLSDSSYFTLARQWGLCSLTKAFTAWLSPEIGRCA